MAISLRIPQSEIHFEFSRSGGKGGQNVNKVETRVQAFWPVFASHILTHEQKESVARKLAGQMNWRGEVMVVASSERSQSQNKLEAVAKLTRFVQKALLVPKKRKATRPSLASKQRRAHSKILHSRVKQTRRGIFR